MHEADPVVLVEPPGHGRHVVALSALYWPATQKLQTREPPLPVPDVPAAQKHVGAPGPLLLLAGQALQLLAWVSE